MLNKAVKSSYVSFHRGNGGCCDNFAGRTAIKGFLTIKRTIKVYGKKIKKKHLRSNIFK